jgi:AcrR family transcriptional regulator
MEIFQRKELTILTSARVGKAWLSFLTTAPLGTNEEFIDEMTNFGNLVTMFVDDIQKALDSFLWPEQDEKQRRKRERLLEAGTQLFQQLGYRRTTISSIAAAAGIAKGTLYLYYKNKAELLYHAMALEESANLSKLDGIVDSNKPAGVQLTNYIVHGLGMIRSMPLTRSMVEGDHEFMIALSEVDEQLLTQINDLQLTLLKQIVSEANPSLTGKALSLRSQVLIDLLFSLTVSGLSNQTSENEEDYNRAVAETLVNGLLPSAESRSRESKPTPSKPNPFKPTKVRSS